MELDASADVRVDAPRDAGRDVVGDAAPPTVPCVDGTFELLRATVEIMFVLDRSGSMSDPFRNTGSLPAGESRWSALRRGLATSAAALDDEVAMGATFFPDRRSILDVDTTGVCPQLKEKLITPARGNLARILNVFDTTRPSGGTPTAAALQRVADEVVDQRALSRVLVLATDGAPNCNNSLNAQACTCTRPLRFGGCTASSCLDDLNTIAVIGNIVSARKMPVYVIGLGSETTAYSDVLDRMAVAGGRPRASVPRHYNVQSGDELETALLSINDSAAKCTYVTKSAPTKADSIAVTIDGVDIPRDTTHAAGWDWVDQAYGKLTLFGEACAAAQASSSRVGGRVTCEKE